MRLARVAHSDGVSFVALEPDPAAPREKIVAVEIDQHPFGSPTYTGRKWPMADVRLLAPILPSKVVCVGKNYADHIAEMKGLTGDAPKEPLLFLKPSTSVIGPGDAIRIPPGSTNVHHEVELGVVIGARGAARQPSSSEDWRPNISFSSAGSMWS